MIPNNTHNTPRITNLLILLIHLVINACLINSKVIRDSFFKGILHDSEYPSATVDLSLIPKTEWKDLTVLAQKNELEEKAVFCSVGPGGWITYPNASFVHGGQYVTLLVGDLCEPAEQIESAQPLGFILGNQEATVALFTKPRFESDSKIAYRAKVSGDYKSLIYMGYGGATVEGTGAKGKVKYCALQIEPDRDAICTVPDTKNAFNFKSSQITVTPGCRFDEDTDLRFLYFQDCYPPGVTVLMFEMDFKPDSMQSLCKGSAKKEGFGNEFLQIMDVWKSRILFESDSFGAATPSRLELFPRVDAYFQFLDIFMMTCPLVDPEYLSLLSHIYLNHMKSVWEQKPPTAVAESINPSSNSTNITDFDSFELTQEYLSICWEALQEAKYTFPPPNPFCGSKISQSEEAAMDFMFDYENFDPIIEQVWYMLNLVGPICNHIGNYATNVWLQFPNNFKKIYLEPAESQWMTPGNWKKVYPIMFHGYDFHQLQASVFACVQSVPGITGGESDFISRTKGFDKLFEMKMNATAKRGKKGGDKKKKEGGEGEIESTGSKDEAGGEEIKDEVGDSEAAPQVEEEVPEVDVTEGEGEGGPPEESEKQLEEEIQGEGADNGTARDARGLLKSKSKKKMLDSFDAAAKPTKGRSLKKSAKATKGKVKLSTTTTPTTTTTASPIDGTDTRMAAASPTEQPTITTTTPSVKDKEGKATVTSEKKRPTKKKATKLEVKKKGGGKKTTGKKRVKKPEVKERVAEQAPPPPDTQDKQTKRPSENEVKISTSTEAPPNTDQVQAQLEAPLEQSDSSQQQQQPPEPMQDEEKIDKKQVEVKREMENGEKMKLGEEEEEEMKTRVKMEQEKRLLSEEEERKAIEESTTTAVSNPATTATIPADSKPEEKNATSTAPAKIHKKKTKKSGNGTKTVRKLKTKRNKAHVVPVRNSKVTTKGDTITSTKDGVVKTKGKRGGAKGRSRSYIPKKKSVEQTRGGTI